jgi:transposase
MKIEWKDDFKKLYKQRGQQKHGIRLLALWKLQSGMTETKVCELIQKTHKTIRKWRRLYEKEGVEGLLMISKGRGRKAKIEEKAKDLAKEIALMQEKRNGGRVRCQDIVDFVLDKYAIEYSRSGMYHVLHRLGFSWITSRSKHPKNSPEAIEDFKKKFHQQNSKDNP